MRGGIRFISAGAGSGKTYRLTQLLFEELQAGRVRPGGVLATTFTNRAATELRERVRSFLVEQCDYDGAWNVLDALEGGVDTWLAANPDFDIEDYLGYIRKFKANIGRAARPADQQPTPMPPPEPWPQD